MKQILWLSPVFTWGNWGMELIRGRAGIWTQEVWLYNQRSYITKIDWYSLPLARDAVPKCRTLSKLGSSHWASEIEDLLARGWSGLRWRFCEICVIGGQGWALAIQMTLATQMTLAIQMRNRNSCLVHAECTSSHTASGWSNGFWVQGPSLHSQLLTG